VVKVNAPEVLRTELGRASWKGEHIAMGTNTDPYQWVEGRYKLMRGIWEALRDFANPCSVLTKSPLLLRDLDLLRELAEVTEVHANLSIPTMDEKPWRASEPHTPSPKARMEAVAELNRAGIPAGILVAPLMPGINDDPKQVERILEAAGEAGATGVSGIALHLRGEVRGIYMEWLRAYRPDLVPRYEALYARGAYVPREEQDRLRRLLTATHVRTGREPPRRSPADTRGVRRGPYEGPGKRGGERPEAAEAGAIGLFRGDGPAGAPDGGSRERFAAAEPFARERAPERPRPRPGRQEALF
jgi:DNA repair photolyase